MVHPQESIAIYRELSSHVARRMLSPAPSGAENPLGRGSSRGRGLGIVSVETALPELDPAPHRSGELGRRIRFVVFTAILVAAICLAAAAITAGSRDHRGHRARSSSHVLPRASIGHVAPVVKTGIAVGRAE